MIFKNVLTYWKISQNLATLVFQAQKNLKLHFFSYLNSLLLLQNLHFYRLFLHLTALFFYLQVLSQNKKIQKQKTKKIFVLQKKLQKKNISYVVNVTTRAYFNITRAQKIYITLQHVRNHSPTSLYFAQRNCKKTAHIVRVEHFLATRHWPCNHLQYQNLTN